MFPLREYSQVYSAIRDKKIDYSPTELDKLLYNLYEIGVLEMDAGWLPIFPEKLKKSLIAEWKQTKGNETVNKIYKALNAGEDYRGFLKDFDVIETKHSKLQSQLKDYFEEIANDYANGKTKGESTGIERLDKYTECLKNGHFWIIAAATNMGKTTLALQIAKRILKRGKRVEFISLEMSARQLLERITWLHATENKIKFERAISDLIDMPFVVTENLRTVETIRAHLENTEADLVVLDYIQLVRGGTSYFDEATMTANLLQEMAIKKMIPVIGISQVTKESYKGGKNFKMDFKGSGAIAESADVALEIYRNPEDTGIVDVDLLLKKNRYGKTGKIDGIQFDTERGYFIY